MAYSKRNLTAPPLFFSACAALAAAFVQLTIPVTSAQTATQQRVYGSSSVTTSTSVLPGYSKDNTTGALTILSGAPFADRLEGGLVAIDGQGKFLFVLNATSNNIAMYQIDAATGALTEVPNSPFAAGPTVNPNVAPSLPISLAGEKSGSFLYVGYANGDSSTTSAIIPFAIDAANLRLALTPQLSLDFGNGAPIQMLADAKGLRLYVGLGPGGSQFTSSAGTMVLSIDAASGVLTSAGNAGGGSDVGRAIAIDPRGRFFFDGWGQTEGFLDSGVISPVDGTSGANFTLNLGQSVFPSVLLAESTGKFLYVQTGSGLQIYSIDQTSGALTLLSGPLASFTFAKGTVVADPMGPFLYSLTRAGVDVFQVDPQTGGLTEIPGAPFGTGSSAAMGSLGLAISGSPTQNVSGPAVQLFPASTDFGLTTVGKASVTKIVSLVNTGDQILAVNGIAITGPNAGDFAQSSTCGATLSANANCSISVLFTPSQSGAEQATLQVTDNAAGSPQSAALSGTGIASAPSVTISPASVDFGSVIEGGTAAPQTIQLSNSGSGVLHISSIALSGSNPGDFSESNNCLAAAISVQGTCGITVNFAAKADGQRSASLVVTDDAANSPQSIAVSGNLASPFQLVAAPSGSTSAAVLAGQSAQYLLQLVPGPGFTGSVTLSCSGAPLGATCNAIPGTLAVSSANSVPFQMTVTTSGSASLFPPAYVGPEFRWWFAVAAILICILVPLCFAKGGQRYERRLALRFAGTVAGAFLVFVHVAGCGGGTTPSPMPQRIVTPPGTTAITVTAKSGTLTPQTIQLALTVR